MQNNNQNKTNTSTQVRNFYSDGMSYMNVSFYNTNLSIKMQPFASKDELGRSSYDATRGQTTTINYEGAFLLWKLIQEIMNGKDINGVIQIPCGLDAQLEFERRMNGNGVKETYLNLTKNGIKIPFKFNNVMVNLNNNGQMVPTVYEIQLGAFQKTLNGYLEGINADRHLDKLTDDYVKLQNNNGNNTNNQYNNNNGGNGYKKKFNNYNNNYNKKPYYNNNGNWNNNPNTQPKQQDISSYQINN